MFDRPTTCRALVVAAMMVVAVPVLATAVHAQQVVLIVNGEPITALDIEQRSKLTQLSTHKVPSRQEIIDELIIEKLKVREAKKFGLELSSSEVDSAYATMASRMRLTADQLTAQLQVRDAAAVILGVDDGDRGSGETHQILTATDFGQRLVLVKQVLQG